MQTYHETIQDSSGNIITTATVTVYDGGTGSPSTIYAENETTTLNNPFTVSDTNYDSDGSFWFKANNGTYDIKVVSGGVTDWKKGIVFVDPAESIKADDKTEAVTYTPVAGQTMFIHSTDGGLFKAVTGAAPGTYSDNGGSYCGTQFIPTDGDGSAAWVRVYSGGLRLAWFNITGLTDDTASFLLIAAVGEIIEMDDETIITDSYANTTDITFSGSGTIKLIDAATTHLFAHTGGVIKFIGDFILDGNKSTQTVSASLGPDLISAQAKVISIGKLTLYNGQRYGFKTNTGAANSSFQHIHVSAMDNTGVLLENTDDSDITKITGTNDNLGHLLNIINDSKGNSIGKVSGYTGAANRFAVELLTNNTKATSPRNNIIGDITVDGQNLGGGVSLSGAHNNTVGNIVAIDCPSIGCLEFAQGASDNTVTSVNAENCNRVAITGTASKQVVRNTIGHVSQLNPISAAIGIYFYEAEKCKINSAIVFGADTNHSIRMQNADQCKVSDFHLDGNSTALDGILIDGSSSLNELCDGEIENHLAASRYAIKDTSANINFFRRIKARSNTLFTSIGAATEIEDCQNGDAPLTGSITLTAGTTTTVANTNITARSRITLTPTNSAAASLTGVFVATKTSLTDFRITHSTAAGTETFDYTIT